MDMLLAWIQGKAYRAVIRKLAPTQALGAVGTYPRRGHCQKDLLQSNKGSADLDYDLKLNKQVIYLDHMQTFAGSPTSNIFALG